MSKNFRIKCPGCGNVVDIPGNTTCQCGTPLILPEDGVIQLCRKSSMYGCAVGFGIYINGIPLGHLGSGETIRIPVSYGHYRIHLTQSFSSSTNDPEFDITPENRYVYLKSRIKFGFVVNPIIIERVTADQMPPIN